jgi:sugar-phosphatase
MPDHYVGLLFDMDGTLVDSTELVESIWAEFARKHRLRLAEVMAFAHGRPTACTVHRFIGDPDLAAVESARLITHEESATAPVREIPGAGQLISALPDTLWAVVTSASATLARRRLLAAHLPLPTVLVSADDVSAAKPSPDGYSLAAQRLGVDINRCAVFEDSSAGIEAGLASGAHTIAIGTLARFDGSVPRHLDFRGFAVVADRAADGITLTSPSPVAGAPCAR